VLSVGLILLNANHMAPYMLPMGKGL